MDRKLPLWPSYPAAIASWTPLRPPPSPNAIVSNGGERGGDGEREREKERKREKRKRKRERKRGVSLVFRCVKAVFK